MFYGLSDDSRETWAEAEESVLETCNTRLDIKFHPWLSTVPTGSASISQEIGDQYFLNFLSYKVKQNFVYNGYELKNTGFCVGGDFSAATRFERRQLLAFAKSLNSRFKLRFNKLTPNNKTYAYDHVGNCVKEKNSITNSKE